MQNDAGCRKTSAEPVLSVLGWNTLCHFYQGLCAPLQPYSRGSSPQVLSKEKTVLLVVGDLQGIT